MSWYCRRCTIRHNRRWCFGGPLHWLVGVGRRMQLYWLRQRAVNIFGKEEGVHIGCSQRNRLSLRFCWALNTLERIATDPYISFCIHVRSSGHSSRQIPHVSPLQLIRPVLDRKAHRCISLACIEHALGWFRADALCWLFWDADVVRRERAVSFVACGSAAGDPGWWDPRQQTRSDLVWDRKIQHIAYRAVSQFECKTKDTW